MSYAVAQIREIEELSDGREPWQPIRHHLGISAFGVNAWTGHAAGDRAREAVEANPQYPMLAYNLACCESLAGRRDDAIEHLRRAVEKSDRMRTLARGDSDLDAIRDEPVFKELIGEPA